MTQGSSTPPALSRYLHLLKDVPQHLFHRCLPTFLEIPQLRHHVPMQKDISAHHRFKAALYRYQFSPGGMSSGAPESHQNLHVGLEYVW